MARKLKLFGTEIIIGKRLFGVGKDDESFGMANIYGTDSKLVGKLDSYKGVVYSCINLIAESYASYQPYIEKRNGKEWTDIGDHEFLKLLRNPGGTGDKAIPISMFDLLYATASFIELQGDCYWYMALGERTRLPREIIILRADKVIQDLDDNGDVIGFFVRGAGNKKIPIDIDEMLPFIGFNPKDPYKGVGTVEAARAYIETDQFTTDFTRNFFRNNAGVSGVLSFKGDITKPAFKKAVRAWREKYQGVDNAGKVMMIRDSDASFVKIGLGLNEIDMTALRKMSVDDIAMMFRVPMPLLGKTEGSGFARANVETLEYIFAKYTIEPKLKRLDAILQFALERYWGATDLRIGHESIIPDDKEFELNTRDKGVDRWLTRNEIRAEDGSVDVPGGDNLLAEINKIPVGDLADLGSGSGSQEKNASQGTGIKIKIKRKAAVASAASPMGLDGDDSKRRPTPLLGKKKDNEPEQQELNSVHKENFRLRLMRNQLAYERRYKKVLKPILADQRKEAKENLEAHASSIKITEDDKTKTLTMFVGKAQQKLFDDSAADEVMESELMPTLIKLGEDQGALALVFAGDTEHEFRMTAAYEDYLRRSTRRMATRFNDETLEKLNKTLAEGIQNGEALDKLKKRVDSVYDNAESYRTLRVARTETLKASNAATNHAYKQTGYVSGKAWYVNPGGCPECAEFDGKTVDLDDDFLAVGESYTYTDEAGEEQTKTNTYDTVEQPPLHPNCRCTIVPVRE